MRTYNLPDVNVKRYASGLFQDRQHFIDQYREVFKELFQCGQPIPMMENHLNFMLKRLNEHESKDLMAFAKKQADCYVDWAKDMLARNAVSETDEAQSKLENASSDEWWK